MDEKRFPDAVSDEVSLEERKVFLEKLTALTRETGIAVGGCGCCNSPYLVKPDNPDKGEYVGYERDPVWWPQSDE